MKLAEKVGATLYSNKISELLVDEAAQEKNSQLGLTNGNSFPGQNSKAKKNTLLVNYNHVCDLDRLERF